MTDPLEHLRYDDPTAPALFDPLTDPADGWDRAFEQYRDQRIENTK